VNLPTKKLVPARVVPATAAVTDIQATPADKLTASPAASADTVASAAVAAVVATQTYMKVSASVPVCFTYFWIPHEALYLRLLQKCNSLTQYTYECGVLPDSAGLLVLWKLALLILL